MSELVICEPWWFFPQVYYQWFFLFCSHLIVSAWSHTCRPVVMKRSFFHGTYYISPLYVIKMKVRREGSEHHIFLLLALCTHLRRLSLKIYKDTGTSIELKIMCGCHVLSHCGCFSWEATFHHTWPCPVQIIHKSQNRHPHVSKITS